ncbi:DNA polymerase III subunit gamma/tau [soil metagenome]
MLSRYTTEHMGNALYRKYRPKSLSEIVGQPHITTTIENALRDGHIGHAYLFTGPRGVGKTSIARILAHQVNGFTYDESQTHLDIIEIDAASNRRIDEIRELRDNVQNAPAEGTYKVYIIDEVHMLTKEAFNALLKTLEEPPAHVIFILATTEVHKLPETIISRTQRFTFKPVGDEQVVGHLRFIAQKENVSISESALKRIAEHSEGSFRDAINMLDQVRHTHDGEITDTDVSSTVGLAPVESVQKLRSSLESKNTKEVLSTLRSLHDQGFQSGQIAKQLAGYIRTNIIATGNVTIFNVVLLKDLLRVGASRDPESLLEIVLLERTVEETGQSKELSPAPNEINTTPQKNPNIKHEDEPTAPKLKPSIPEPTQNQAQAVESESPTPTIPTKPRDTKPVRSNKKGTVFDENPAEVWNKVLQELKGAHNTLYGMARMAVPSIDGTTFRLACKYPFHLKRLTDTKHKEILNTALRKVSSQEYELLCERMKKNTAPEFNDRPPLKSSTDGIDDISNIFAGVEVLES